MNYYTFTEASISVIIKQTEDQLLYIPIDENNLDYAAYLAWVAEGNTPTEWTPKA